MNNKCFKRKKSMTILFGIFGCFLAVTSALPIGSQCEHMMGENATMDYLMKYGYAGSSNPDPRIAELVQTDMEMALKIGLEMFQMRYGLDVTGVMNNETSHLMCMRRCGNKDIITIDDSVLMNETSKRHKRYATIGRWQRKLLTYRVTRYPQDNDLTDSQVDTAIARAFQLWANVANLEFERISRGIPDIIIKFNAYDHRDFLPFDGPGGNLAHAFYPLGNGFDIEGDAHFDESEYWTLDGNGGTEAIDLFMIAAHEFGHSLGLRHSSDPTAVMAPFAQYYIPNFQLSLDDILGIQSLYGSRYDYFCSDPPIDAITLHGERGLLGTEIFKGDYYMRIVDQRIEEGYPKAIQENWPGVSGSIDAALYLPVAGNPSYTFLFSGRFYYVYTNDMRLEIDRRPISELGLPSNIDAIFVWGRTNRIFAMKGSKYYRLSFSESNPMLSVDRHYPQDISAWNLPFSTVDAVQRSRSNDIYFFSGNNYYLYDNKNLRVADGYPRAIREIYGCPNEDDDGDDDDDGVAILTAPFLTVMMASCLSLHAALCAY